MDLSDGAVDPAKDIAKTVGEPLTADEITKMDMEYYNQIRESLLDGLMTRNQARKRFRLG